MKFQLLAIMYSTHILSIQEKINCSAVESSLPTFRIRLYFNFHLEAIGSVIWSHRRIVGEYSDYEFSLYISMQFAQLTISGSLLLQSLNSHRITVMLMSFFHLPIPKTTNTNHLSRYKSTTVCTNTTFPMFGVGLWQVGLRKAYT